VGGISVVIPVKDGARYLPELLGAVRAQRIGEPVEIVVVDSGSRDGSADLARAAGATVIEIEPSEFGHGRTRNLAAERTTGRCIAFLTQDATPASDTWLAELVAPLDAGGRVGMSFGPHLPRPGTTPAVARELEEFFGSFERGGGEAVRVDRTIEPADPASAFFSNVNSCLLRECWKEVRFRDVGYAEDQAFARDAIVAGWAKAYVPRAAVLHSHDYPFAQFMRRYFDEYRGLRESTGHVEPVRGRTLLPTVAKEVRGDLDYMRRHGRSGAGLAAGGLRSARHHLGRAVAAPLGSRASALPDGLVRRLSLERRGAVGGRPATSPLAGRPMDPHPGSLDTAILGHYRGEVAPLELPSPHDGQKPLMHLAWVIPPFRRGSGGHMTIFTIMRELEAMGHSNSIWVHDPGGRMDPRSALAHREINEHFVPLRAGVFMGFDDWHGADVAIATGWQTAFPVESLPGCKLKAYFVQDYEPDFYPASAHRLWAEGTYRLGFPCIAASPWLRDEMRDRYGARAEAFELGVDFDVYSPEGRDRDPATVVYYCRPSTPRRATELGLLALHEVVRRRPDTHVVMFGDRRPPAAPFPFEWGGIAPPQRLAALYNSATAGLVISLTNYSRMPKEMMACGLPVVDVNHPSVLSVFGAGGDLITACEPDPLSLADGILGLLEDPERRARQAAAAREFVSGMTWTAAAQQVDGALRAWLVQRWAERERAGTGARVEALQALEGRLT
jgi:glycosyltransferase involved in cell wall biosynthesis